MQSSIFKVLGGTLTLAVLAACGSLPSSSQAQGQAFSSQGGDLPVYGPTPEPVPVPGARPITLGGFEAMQGDGIFYFNGPRMTQLRLGEGSGGRWPVLETISDAESSTINGHLGMTSLVRDGERQALGRPTTAAPGDGGTVIMSYASKHPVRVAVRMKAYDVAGLPVKYFLRTPDNHPKPESARVGEARFPAGAVAYLAEVRFMEDVLLLPKKESFTGAQDPQQMVSNFSRSIPYCLAYEDRDGAKPYAMQFKTAPGAKKGPALVYPAKVGTLFCARANDEVLGEGEWEERTVGGTRAVVLNFPAKIDPLDTGVGPAEREAAKIAFIEAIERAPATTDAKDPKGGKGAKPAAAKEIKGTPSVRPGKLYVAGSRVLDYQYRFNKTAADAVRTAMGI